MGVVPSNMISKEARAQLRAARGEPELQPKPETLETAPTETPEAGTPKPTRKKAAPRKQPAAKKATTTKATRSTARRG